MIDWLFNLPQSLRPGDAGVELALTYPLPAWLWALVVLAAVAVAVWSYRRLEGPLAARLGLATIRAGLLVLLAFLAAGPRLVRPNETTESDWVLVLVDRSASMSVADVPDPANPLERQPREQQLRAALTTAKDALARVGKERRLVFLGFDSGVANLVGNDQEPTGVALGTPAGTRSDLGEAIERALAKAAARPVAGLIILSDGRATDQVARATLRRLQQEQIPIVSVPLGSATPLADVAVRSAASPGVAFSQDVVPVEAVIERLGPLPAPDGAPTDPPASSAGAPPARTRVQLIDTATQQVLDEQTIDWARAAPGGADAPTVAATDPDSAATGPTTREQQRRLTLTATPGLTGKVRWAVRVLPGEPDLVDANNSAAFNVELIDRPLRVLYLDGYPRWEYRYLVSLLTREKSIASTTQLLSPVRRYIQEGNTPIAALPATDPEWDAIDVLILGDLGPDVLSPDQLRQIRRRVSAGGMGLLWIAGEGQVPQAWRNTVLSDLLPVSPRLAADQIRPHDRDVTIKPTPAADRLGVLRLLRTPDDDSSWWPKQVADPAAGWSRIRWAQRLEPGSLKPAAEVLATATPVGDSTSADATPLLVSMRYGAGRILYLGTDEIWRWRFGRGEDLPERFYLQLIRLLGREAAARAGRRALLATLPARPEAGRPARVRAEILDQTLLDTLGSTLTVRVRRLGDAGAAESAPAISPPPNSPPPISPRPGGNPATPDTPAETPTSEAPIDLVLRPSSTTSDARAQFVAPWVPPARGLYRLELLGPGLSSIITSPSSPTSDANAPQSGPITLDVEVFLPDDELRRPETDHAFLASLSRQTGGSVLPPSRLADAPAALPRRALKIALAPDTHTLWDTPAALIALLSLLTLEWVGRRLLRLA